MSTAPRLSAAKRDWGDDDSLTPILHVDMDAFFVECELAAQPHLRGRPLIVGGTSLRGVVSSASYEARASGVHAGQPLSQARRMCPQAVVIPTSHGLYGRVSRRVMAVLADVTPVIEKVSVDEAFLDVTSVRRLLGRPVDIARLIRRRLHTELGLPASVGIASTKLVAKIASAHAKPDGVLLVPDHATIEFLHMLPVGAMWGVGPATKARLASRGMRTIRDIAYEPVESLRGLLGESAAAHLSALAWGRDPRPVTSERVEKSVGTETTFATDVFDRELVDAVLLDQSHATATRLRELGMLASTVAVKLRAANFQTRSRSRSLSAPTDTARDIAEVARGLTASLPVPQGGYRLVGVRAERLVPAEQRQLALLDDGRIREAEGAMDAINRKFGPASVRPATLLDGRGAAGE